MAKKPFMVKPWQMPDPLKPSVMQDKAAFQPYYIDHLANLEIDSPTSQTVLTTIVCTFGPLWLEDNTFIEMIENGMRVVKIDMRGGSLDDHRKTIEFIRVSVENFSKMNQTVCPLSIVIDLQGPEILTGALLKEKEELVEGEVIILTTHPAFDDRGTKDKIFVDYLDLHHVVQPKNKIFLDFGRIELQVRGVVDNDIMCEIVTGGPLRDHRTVVVPGVTMNLPPLSDKDKRDLQFASDYYVDAVFVASVRDWSNIRDVRKQLGERGSIIMVFAKIDNKVGFENFDEILRAADGIVINRGALSIEMSTEKVILAQKSMIARCNKLGKPVFSMTDFLSSMVVKACPTIAEVADVSSCVLDGADGMVLNEETSIGGRPVKTVRTLSTLCREAESEAWAHEFFNTLNINAIPPVNPAEAICIAAVEASLKAHAAAIMVVTTSGKSAQLIAKFRPRCPVIAITRYVKVARQLNMWRGLVPIVHLAAPISCWLKDVDMRLQLAINVAKTRGIVAPGDPLIMVYGWQQGSGFTNNIRFVYASSAEPYTNPKSVLNHAS